MTQKEDPDWPRQAAAGVAHEIASYLRTVWAVTRSPSKFAAAWSAGERPALNPLACLFNSLAVIGPWHVLWANLLGVGQSAPLWSQLARPLMPVAAACFLAGGVHLVLRLRGRVRPLRTTLGMTLFVQAGVFLPAPRSAC